MGDRIRKDMVKKKSHHDSSSLGSDKPRAEPVSEFVPLICRTFMARTLNNDSEWTRI